MKRIKQAAGMERYYGAELNLRFGCSILYAGFYEHRRDGCVRRAGMPKPLCFKGGGDLCFLWVERAAPSPTLPPSQATKVVFVYFCRLSLCWLYLH